MKMAADINKTYFKGKNEVLVAKNPAPVAYRCARALTSCAVAARRHAEGAPEARREV